MSIIHGILALLGLGFLIFIHELGHYWVARRVGMKVEVFSIGFGRPIWVWYRGDVKWQVCWLPFGGYVKMAGMDTQDNVDPHQVEGGFWTKGPWDRIKVLFAGPGANFLFAFVVFIALWGMGGRVKSFSELTHHVGWVDPKSELYEFGVRPGDRVDAYNGHPFRGFRDHIYAAVLDDHVVVEGEHFDLHTGAGKAFQYDVKPYTPEDQGDKGLPTIGIQNPARFLLIGSDAEDLAKASPLVGSDLDDGDRILWVDGEMVMSALHLSKVLNSAKVLLTVQRGDQNLHLRVPLYPLKELYLEEIAEELSDWQYAAGYKDRKFRDLKFIAFNLSPNGVVEGGLDLLNNEQEEERRHTLQLGDRIVAVQGIPVETGPQIFSHLQKKKVNLIVQSDGKFEDVVPLEDAENQFIDQLPLNDLQTLLVTFGTPQAEKVAGDLRLLGPIQPITRQDYWTQVKGEEAFQEQYAKQRKQLADIDDPEVRGRSLQLLKELQQEVMLGVPLADRKVSYNPPPHQLFSDVMRETVRTFVSLVAGNLQLQMMSGPIGIVQVIHVQWAVGVKEAMFWLAFISINLAFLNLLPIPVLDGGYILLSLVEMVTGRKLKPKTIERLIIPFAVMLILLFVYLTFNDLTRIFGPLWK